MIKIDRNFKDLAETHRQNIERDYSISTKLSSLCTTHSADPLKSKFYTYLHTHWIEILEGDPQKLEKIINDVTSILGSKDFFTKKIRRSLVNGYFKKEVFEVFDYDNFSSKKKGYNAYKLTETLKINTCPYCNRQDTSTLLATSQNKGKTRPTLDHFFDKGSFPFLALSFWNLIPSCYSCNSQFKSTKAFSLKTHLHPYLNGFEGILHFRTNIIDVNDFIGNMNKDFSLKLLPNKKAKPNKEILKKAKKNDTDFRLGDLYETNHKVYVKEIIQKSIVYNKSYSKDLFDNFKGVFDSIDDARKMVLGNYIEKTHFEKRPLAKLTHDIAEELGLI